MPENINVAARLGFLLLLTTSTVFAQEIRKDTVLLKTGPTNKQLEDVVIIGEAKNSKTKALSTLDNYLEQAEHLNMVRRGAYAWEPLLNGMNAERSVITIDGMRIYSACTDKMDPVTSYVEISNLARAKINSGQAGNANGAAIAGSIDLERSKSNFNNTGFNAAAFAGFESANNQHIGGAALHYAGKKVFTDLDFTYRDADNYKAGGGSEILYSQFTKYNLSATTGIKLTADQHLEASVILDRAVDVGYPALPMDVAKAEALISSLSYIWQPGNAFFQKWESKIYYNYVNHIMDDSKRPDVPIRMDMPGWSRTSGLYSKLEGQLGNHQWMANLSAHYNQSYAEMTMHSNNPAEPDMFMLTWPNIGTTFSNLFLSDKISLGDHQQLLLSAGLAYQRNNIGDAMGLSSLQIFYPSLNPAKTTWLPNVSVGINIHHDRWLHNLSGGFSTRAPSVSEGYGFYLFNSADRFDYIGNPLLNNEKSAELSATSTYNGDKLSLKFSANFFHVSDYIIGMPDFSLSPMTIGANGIKIYEQLPYASLLNLSASASFQIVRQLGLEGRIAYGFGRTNNGEMLPQIRPLEFRAALKYQRKDFTAEANMEAATKKSNYSTSFGELPLAGYAIYGAAIGKDFRINNNAFTLKAGIENILDKYYTTFSDWNRFPRMGRNFFINLIYQFK